MAVLFSPFVHGNIENYKEIESQSWHMSGMRFNSTSDSKFQIQALIISQNEKLFGFLDGFSQTEIIRKKRVILYVYT